MPSSQAFTTFPAMPPTDQDRLNERLLDAAWQHSVPKVRDLLQRGAQPDAPHYGLGTFVQQPTPLLYTFQGLDAMARFSRENLSEDPRVQALRAAGVGQHAAAVTIVDLLLEAGADPNRANASGELPLHLAAASSTWDLVTRLLDAGADPLRCESSTASNPRPVLLAVMDAQDALLRRLVAMGCSLDPGPEPVLRTRRTLLHHLLMRKEALLEPHGTAGTVRTLIGLGVDPNAPASSDRPGEQKITALMLAGRFTDPDRMRAVTAALVDGGALVNQPCEIQVRTLDSRGKPLAIWTERRWTPLMNAVNEDRRDVIQELVAHGADLGQRLEHEVGPVWVEQHLGQDQDSMPRPSNKGLNVVELAWSNQNPELATMLERLVLEQGVAPTQEPTFRPRQRL